MAVADKPRIVEGTDGQSTAEHVDHFHRQIESAGGLVKTNSQIGTGKDFGVVFGRQPGEHKLGVLEAVRLEPVDVIRLERSFAGDKANHLEIVGVGDHSGRMVLVEIVQRIEQDLKVLIFGPAGATDHDRWPVGLQLEGLLRQAVAGKQGFILSVTFDLGVLLLQLHEQCVTLLQRVDRLKEAVRLIIEDNDTKGSNDC